MPLIMISGYPASGKTHRSEQLRSYFESRIAASEDTSHKRLSVVHISDDTLGVSRSVYDAARTEKDARGTLSSAVKRALSRDVIVICDAMNYIKGFRYQLHCETKAVQTTCCVVHVGTPIDKCREINEKRLTAVSTDETSTPTQAASEELSSHNSDSIAPKSSSPTSEALPYDRPLFDNLVFRYEEPNGMTRWDSPLFTVPFDDPEPPNDAIWEALVGASGQKKIVRPNMATVAPVHQSANALQHMEHTTSTIVGTIQSTLGDNPEASEVKVAGVEEPIRLPPMQKVTLPQLQRLRRQFLQMQRSQFGKLGGDGKGLEEGRVGQAFVYFLNGSFGTE